MLKLDKDEITPVLNKLRALPDHLRQWQTQQRATRSFRLTIGKPPVKAAVTQAGGDAKAARRILEREQAVAKLQAEAERFLKSI